MNKLHVQETRGLGTFLPRVRCRQPNFGDVSSDLLNTSWSILSGALVAPHPVRWMSLHLFPMVESQGVSGTTLVVWDKQQRIGSFYFTESVIGCIHILSGGINNLWWFSVNNWSKITVTSEPCFHLKKKKKKKKKNKSPNRMALGKQFHTSGCINCYFGCSCCELNGATLDLFLRNNHSYCFCSRMLLLRFLEANIFTNLLLFFISFHK